MFTFPACGWLLGWETNTEIRNQVRRGSRQPGNCWTDEKKMHTQETILSVGSIYRMALGVETSNLVCDCGTEFVTELARSGENGKRGTFGKTVGGELGSLSPVSLVIIIYNIYLTANVLPPGGSGYNACT
jgi:hypothetical protein